MEKIVLASASPRRIEIFRKNGVDVEVMPADIEENLPEGIKATDAVMFLALKKALYVESEILKKGIADDEIIKIVAADTVVFKEKIFGKPKDEKNAFEMLSELRNDIHFVATGVAVIEAGREKRKVFYEKTDVVFDDYSDDDIMNYISTGEPMDKAGAYAIQGGFGKYVKKYNGSYENIVGFPWEMYVNEMNW